MKVSRLVAGIMLSFALLFAAHLSFAQLTQTGSGKKAGGGGALTCSQATNFLARATGVTSQTDKDNYSNLLCGLEADNVGCSNTFDQILVYAAVNVTTAKLNLCGTSFSPAVSHGTNVDTSGFTQYVGYTGNSSDRYIDTTFNPNTAAGFYGATNASFGVCVTTNNTGTMDEMGVRDNTGSENRLIASFGGSLAIFEINTNTQDLISSTSSTGFWHLVRTATTATQYYLNGASFGTGSQGHTNLVNFNFYTLAQNVAGTAGTFTNNTQAFSLIGKSVSSGDALKVRNRFNTYLTQYSVTVC